MANTQKIGIIGLGMIGGSIALSLRERYRVVGYDSDSATVEYARSAGVCEVVPPERMRDCDVVFACVPVSVMRETLDMLADKLGDGVIISDVASVKTPFAASRGRYVGGHPMAGSERGGLRAAKAHMFQNAYWVLTASGSDADTVERVVRDTGAIPLTMSAEEHDMAVSQYSHVPHAAAYALVSAAYKSGAKPIAGSGFLDTTRIAASSESFWANVFSLNAANVRAGISALVSELNDIDGMIARGDRQALIEYLGSARTKREALNKFDLGGEALYVDLVDRVGEFERITGAIARAGINVVNIALVPGREGASGALRLEFADEKDRQAAQTVLGLSGGADGAI